MIEVKNLIKVFEGRGKPVRAVDDVSTRVSKGEVVVIIGPSGSGKSTFLRCLNGLEAFDDGQVIIDGVDLGDSKTNINTVRREVGMVFQHFNLFPHKTVLENVTLAQRVVRKRKVADAETKAMALLTKVGIAEKAHEYPSRLSGGQQQRVAIARAIANHPPLILADEPTGNLDTQTSGEIMALFGRLNAEQGITLILVTHEPDIARYARRLVRFKDGRIVHDGEVRV